MVNILLKSEIALNSLMSWKDRNKDLVRAVHPAPLIPEGSIIFKDVVSQEFKQEGEIVRHTYKAGGVIEALTFDFNTRTWEVTNVKDLLHWDYPQRQTIQDIITVHASCMAFIRHSGKDVSQAKVITLNEGLNGSLEVLVEC